MELPKFKNPLIKAVEAMTSASERQPRHAPANAPLLEPQAAPRQPQPSAAIVEFDATQFDG